MFIPNSIAAPGNITYYVIFRLYISEKWNYFFRSYTREWKITQKFLRRNFVAYISAEKKTQKTLRQKLRIM